MMQKVLNTTELTKAFRGRSPSVLNVCLIENLCLEGEAKSMMKANYETSTLVLGTCKCIVVPILQFPLLNMI